MRLASFLLFLALPQARAADVTQDTYLVVESSCTKKSKTCKALTDKASLPKGVECGTPAKGHKWIPGKIAEVDTLADDLNVGSVLSERQAVALAEKANKGELKGLCLVEVPQFM